MCLLPTDCHRSLTVPMQQPVARNYARKSPVGTIRLGAITTLSMGLSMFVIPALGVLGPLLVSDLNMSRASLGTLTALIFVVAAILSPSAGGIADRLGGRTSVVVMLAITASALTAIAAAPSYIWMVAAVLLAGVPVSMNNPVTNQLLAAHATSSNRGVLTGIKQSGVQFSVLAAGVLLPPLAATVGWRGTLLLPAAFAAVCAVLGVFTVPATPMPVAHGRETFQLRSAFQAGPVGWLTAYGVFMGGPAAAVQTYVPLYAHEALGFTVTGAGAFLGFVGAVGVVARVVLGWSSDRLPSVPATLTVLSGLAILSGAFVMVSAHVGVWSLWMGGALFGVSTSAWNAVAALTIVRDVKAGMTGRSSGLVLLGFYIGFIFAPVIFGASVDATGAYTAGWILVVLSYIGAGAVALAWRRNVRDPG